MPHIFVFVGSQLRHMLDMNVVGGISYSTKPSQFSLVGAHHLSIAERTGGKHYDFFVKTPEEADGILTLIMQSSINQKDVTVVFDAAINSQNELHAF